MRKCVALQIRWYPLSSHIRPFRTIRTKLLLTYDSHRQMCPVLCGCIEGAADRFGEKVIMVERACMQHGARACLLEVRFFGLDVSKVPVENMAMQNRHREQHMADTIPRVLPFEDGVTLQDLETLLRVRSGIPLHRSSQYIVKCSFTLTACRANHQYGKYAGRYSTKSAILACPGLILSSFLCRKSSTGPNQLSNNDVRCLVGSKVM